MDEEDKIEESFKVENPFLGTWKAVDGSDATVVFYNNNQLHIKTDSLSQWFTYTFNSEKLMLHESHKDSNVVEQFPYDFLNKRTFTFSEKEIKKVSLALP